LSSNILVLPLLSMHSETWPRPELWHAVPPERGQNALRIVMDKLLELGCQRGFSRSGAPSWAQRSGSGCRVDRVERHAVRCSAFGALRSQISRFPVEGTLPTPPTLL
jgi:hypothetical protein